MITDAEWKELTTTKDVELQKRAALTGGPQRWLLAHNENLDPLILKKLVDDKSSLVTGTVYHNPSLSEAQRKSIETKDNMDVKRMVHDDKMPHFYGSIKSIFERD